MSDTPAMRPPLDPQFVPSLDEAPVGPVMPIPAAGEPDTLLLPAAPGVAIFENPQGQAVFIAVTANLRELARKRLLSPADGADASRSWHTDYRAITARVLTFAAACSLEAEALYLHCARTRLPLAYATVIERWRPWFVHVDPSAEHPEWSKTNLIATARPREASRAAAPLTGLTLGPLRDKDAAGRLIERTIDAFDLCRFPNLLQQSPHAAPCAYKEMGRCPAPCDGSESLDNYRARVLEAARAIGASSRSDVRAALESRMQAAAGAHDFESAARCKRALDHVLHLDDRATAHASDLARWNLVIITRGPRPRTARVLAFTNLRILPIADALLADAKSARAAAEQISPTLHALADLQTPSGPPHEHINHIDHITAVARFLALPAKKMRGEVLPLTASLTPQSLSAALARIAKVSTVDVPDIEDQSVESM